MFSPTKDSPIELAVRRTAALLAVIGVIAVQPCLAQGCMFGGCGVVGGGIVVGQGGVSGGVGGAVNTGIGTVSGGITFGGPGVGTAEGLGVGLGYGAAPVMGLPCGGGYFIGCGGGGDQIYAGCGGGNAGCGGAGSFGGGIYSNVLLPDTGTPTTNVNTILNMGY